jgi:hypothetical protein
MTQTIKPQKNCTLADDEVLGLAKLLLKAGYTVTVRRIRLDGKTSGPFVKYIEFTDPDS